MSMKFVGALTVAWGSSPGWNWNNGYAWPWALLWLAFAVLFWGSLIAILVWAVRSASRPSPHQDSAMQVLQRRLAAGELTQEEYDRIKRLLQDQNA